MMCFGFFAETWDEKDWTNSVVGNTALEGEWKNVIKEFGFTKPEKPEDIWGRSETATGERFSIG